MKRVGQKNLRSNRLLRFIQMFLEICHERRPACPHGRGVAGMGLILAVNVAVGVADVDLAKLREEIDASAVSGPEIGTAEFPIADITGEHGATQVISGFL